VTPPPPTSGAAFGKVRREQERRVEKLSEAYARVLLSCSNFEQTLDDLLFFESFYHFTFLVMKRCVDTSPFDQDSFAEHVKIELSYVFRGSAFNLEARQFEKRRETEEQALRDRLKKNLAEGSTGLDSLNDEIALFPAGGRGGDGSFTRVKASGCHRDQAGGHSSFRARPPHGARKNSQPPAANMRVVQGRELVEPGATGKRSRQLPLPENRDIGIESIHRCRGHPKAEAQAAPDPRNLTASIQAPHVVAGLVNLSPKRKTSRAKQFSIHQALHARSPMVSLLLPSPLELARRNAEIARKRPASTSRKEVRTVR